MEFVEVRDFRQSLSYPDGRRRLIDVGKITSIDMEPSSSGYYGVVLGHDAVSITYEELVKLLRHVARGVL